MVPAFLHRTIAALMNQRRRRSLHQQVAIAAPLVLVASMLLGAFLVMVAEHGAAHANLTSYGDSLWWTVETATTVGYGEFYPVTFWGRVVAVVVMVVGITTFGAITAAIAAWFVGREQRRQRAVTQAEHAMRELRDRFDRLEGMLG
ncbi:potassium channel family protein, partial [Streptomyces hainanensis]